MKKMLFLLMSSLLIGNYAYSQTVVDAQKKVDETKGVKAAEYLSTLTIRVVEPTEKSDSNASFGVDLVFAKGFEKKMILYITPTLHGKECSELKLEGKDTNKMIIQGEKVLDNYDVVSNLNGAKLSYRYVYSKRKLNYNKLGFKVVAKLKNNVLAEGTYKRSGDNFTFIPAEQ